MTCEKDVTGRCCCVICSGHPLHSTALEDDLQPPQVEGPKPTEVPKKIAVHETKEATIKQRGVSAKRKQGLEGEEEEEEKENPRKRNVKAKDR